MGTVAQYVRVFIAASAEPRFEDLESQPQFYNRISAVYSEKDQVRIHYLEKGTPYLWPD